MGITYIPPTVNQADRIKIKDLENNYDSATVEGALSEAARKQKDMTAQIENAKYDDTELKRKTQTMQQDIDSLVLHAGNPESSSAEITQARGTHALLKDRFESNEGQFEQIVLKNGEQDTRLDKVEYVNKRQDVVLNGLLNEGGDGRLSIEGTGNNIKLEHSKNGVVEVNKVVGNTLVNLGNKLLRSNVPAWFTLLHINNIKQGSVYTVYVDNTLSSISMNLRYKSDDSTIYTITNNTSVMFTFTAKDSLGLTIKNRDVIGDVNGYCLILEGDYTNKPIPSEYFEGMQSSFEDCQVTQAQVDSGEEKVENLGKYKANVEVVGKNKWLNSYHTKDKYEINKFQLAYRGTKLKVGKPNTQYVITPINPIIPDGQWLVLNLVEHNGIIKEAINICKNGSTTNNRYKSAVATTDENGFIAISMYVLDFNSTKHWSTYQNLQIQLEEGAVATQYEPYKHFSQTLYLDEPLYSNNELCVHDGKLGYWKNRERVVLDGSENWKFSINWLQGDTIGFYNENMNIGNIVSDKFTTTSENIAQIDYECIRFPSKAWIGIRISKSKLTTQDLSGFKAWLQANPTTVEYELAEPIFVPILENTPQWILNSFNQCSVQFETNVPILSSSFKYTGNVPSVYGMDKSIQTIENHNMDMVATTWDMDFRLFEVEWKVEEITGVTLGLTDKLNNTKEAITMAGYTKFEQAKMMILGGAYERTTLTRQLDMYVKRGVITQDEYDELISLMDAQELVSGK